MDLPVPDELVQRRHELLGGGVVVPTVDVAQVDVVGPQALEDRVDAVPEVFPVEPAAVRVVRPGRPVDLGRDGVVLAVGLDVAGVVLAAESPRPERDLAHLRPGAIEGYRVECQQESTRRS